MARNRERSRGRRTSKPFFMLPRDVIESAEFAGLSGNAVKLLVDLGAQYNGKNNGDLGAWWNLMRKKGWRSKDTLYRALRELQAAGFILRTRQGGMNRANLFAITFFNIDECGGKIDVKPTKVAPNTWRKLNPPVRIQDQPSPNIVPILDRETR